MGQDWIEARFKTFSEKQRLEQLARQQQAKILANAGSMFDGLLMEVRDAVHHYNRLFPADSQAVLKESASDFRVEVGKNAVQVLRNPAIAIIGIKFFADGAASEEQFEIVLNSSGALRYKYGTVEKSVTEAVEAILDRVFCK